MFGVGVFIHIQTYRDKYHSSYQGDSSRRCGGYDNQSSRGDVRNDGYCDQLDKMTVALENLRQSVFRQNDRSGHKTKTVMPDKFDEKAHGQNS